MISLNPLSNNEEVGTFISTILQIKKMRGLVLRGPTASCVQTRMYSGDSKLVLVTRVLQWPLQGRLLYLLPSNFQPLNKYLANFRIFLQQNNSDW